MLLDLSATMGRSRMRRGTSLEVINEENSFASLSSTDANHEELQAAVTSSMQHHQINMKRSLMHINPFGTGPRKKATSVESLLAESPDDDWGVAEYVEPEVKQELAKNGHMRINSDHGNYASLMTPGVMATTPTLAKHAANDLKEDQPHAHQLSVDDGLGEEILTESSSSVNTSHDDDDIIHGSRPGSTNGHAMFILPESRSLQRSTLQEETDEENVPVTPKPAPRKHKPSQKRKDDVCNEAAEADETTTESSEGMDAFESPPETDAKHNADDAKQLPCVENLDKEPGDSDQVAEAMIGTPHEDSANTSKLDESVEQDEGIGAQQGDLEGIDSDDHESSAGTPADLAEAVIEDSEASTNTTVAKSDESQELISDDASSSTIEQEEKTDEAVSATTDAMDANMVQSDEAVTPEPLTPTPEIDSEKQPVEEVVHSSTAVPVDAVAAPVSIETLGEDGLTASDVELESHTGSDLVVDNRQDSLTLSSLSVRAGNKRIILIDGNSEAETASNESSPPLEGRYDIWPTSPVMSDDFPRDFASHEEEKPTEQAVEQQGPEELPAAVVDSERLVDEDSHTFASLKNVIECQINARYREAEQQSPQRRSSAKFLEKYTSNPNLLLRNDDIVIHDTSPTRETKSDDEEKLTLATPPKNREVDPKELPQPLMVKKVRELFEQQFSQHKTFDSARLKSVKKNPESMILRRGSSGQAMLEEGISTQRPFVKALSFYRYLASSSGKEKPDVRERRKFKRTTSDEYDPREGWRCWSPIVSDDDDDIDGNSEFVREYPTFLRTKQVDPSVLNKLRTFGTSITYFGGRVIENQPYSNNTFAREIMREIRRENDVKDTTNNKQMPPKVIGCIFKQDCR